MKINKLTIEQELEVIKLKNNKVPVKKIMDKFNIKSNKTVYDIVKRNGRSHQISNKKYDVNSNYFEDINTEEKSYWLGFLYADGYVRLRRSGELKLKLKQTDREHIELFRVCIESTHPIKNDISNVKYGNNKISKSKLSYISINNTKMVKDLIKFGCVNNKSFIIKLPKLKNDLIRHFIRGYFDGDGCIYISKNNNNCTFNITSGSKNIIDDINDVFKNIQIIKCYIKITKNTYRLNIYDKIELLKLYNYLYDNSTIYLKRKFNKFKSYINFKTL